MPFPRTDFPSTAEIARWKAEDDYFRIYNADLTYTDGLTKRGLWRLKEFFENDVDKAKILDVALHLAPLAVDAGTDFLFGRPVKIEIDGEEAKYEATKKLIEAIRKRNSLNQKLKESATIFQAVGHTQFKVYAELGPDGKRQAVMEEIPYDNYSPNWDDVPYTGESKDQRIITHITRTDGEAETKYIYIENYYLTGDGAEKKCVCHKSLWTDSAGKIGDPVALSVGGITTASGAQADPNNALAMIEDTGLKELPIVKFDMRKTVKDRYGQPLLKKAMPILHQINDRLTQIGIQFLKHLNAKLQIPEASAPDNREGAIKQNQLEVLLARAGDPEAKYITNDNPLIEQSFEYIHDLIRAFAKLTKRPDSFFIEDEKGGVEKAESLRTRLMYFLREIDNYVSTYDPGVEKLLRLCLKIEGDQNADTVPLKLTFDPGLPKEWQSDVTVWGDAYAQKIASQKTAVARFQGIEGDELEKELEAIQGDEERFMQSQLDLMDARKPDDPNADQ